LIFAIDHIVFAATLKQCDDLIGPILNCGFAAVDFHLDFPDDNLASDSVGFRGGSFLEFVYETTECGGPPQWFAETPRVIGLGFSSDDFAADTAWDGKSGSWTMAEQQGFPNSAGPHEHVSDFYVFVMNRENGTLQFPQLTAGPRLVQITLSGAGSAKWRERLWRWLKLPASNGGLTVGGTQIVFEDGPSSNVRASLTFEAATNPAIIPLSSGEIRLVSDERMSH
jgi:hypothetical protein